MDKAQVRGLIVSPTLKKLDMYSTSAVNLLMGTAAQESHMGEYIKQVGSGPALGIFQMEPATYNDIWDNYLKYKPDVAKKVAEIGGCTYPDIPIPETMIGNLWYAAAMCRIHYRRVSESLPAYDDVRELASYWKRYYNTVLGAGTEEEFIHNYERFVK